MTSSSLYYDVLPFYYKVKECSCALLEDDTKFDTLKLGLNNLQTWKCYEIEEYKGAQNFVKITFSHSDNCRLTTAR